MSRGLQIALVSSILLLALGVAGLGAYVFLGPGPTASTAQPAAANADTSDGAEATAVFFKTKNFVTDLADKDRLRYVDVTVALAIKDEVALEAVKKLEPQIRDIILSQLRVRVSADLAGAVGKEKLAETLQTGLTELLKSRLVKVYVTDLIIQ